MNIRDGIQDRHQSFSFLLKIFPHPRNCLRTVVLTPPCSLVYSCTVTQPGTGKSQIGISATFSNRKRRPARADAQTGRAVTQVYPDAGNDTDRLPESESHVLPLIAVERTGAA